MKKTLLRAVLVIGAVFATLLGYGYWHVLTHAAHYIDISLVTDPAEKPQPMLNAEVSLHAASGKLLARGASDAQYNFLHLFHPEVGDCHALESAATASREGRTAWQECFEQLSTWLPGWVEEVRQAEVKYNDCLFKEIPVTLQKRNSDWLLWWVPLPHVGGKPYSYYRATLSVDGRDCIPLSPTAD